MRRKKRKDLDHRVARAVSQLHAVFDTLPSPIDVSDTSVTLETFAESTAGELLFELPADHPQLGETQWAVLRYQRDDRQRFVHLFYSPANGRCWIGQDSDAPMEFSNFAHAWTDVLTRCVAGLDSYRPSLGAAS
jgi:hypothetical protein